MATVKNLPWGVNGMEPYFSYEAPIKTDLPKQETKMNYKAQRRLFGTLAIIGLVWWVGSIVGLFIVNTTPDSVIEHYFLASMWVALIPMNLFHSLYRAAVHKDMFS